jgi:hypothetical protein
MILIIRLEAERYAIEKLHNTNINNIKMKLANQKKKVLD